VELIDPGTCDVVEIDIRKLEKFSVKTEPWTLSGRKEIAVMVMGPLN